MKIVVVYFIMFEQLGVLEKIFPEFGQVDYIHYTDIERLQDQIEEADLLFIGGGPLSVSDSDLFPSLKTLEKVLHKRIYDNKNNLGICFGAQLIAKCLGSTISKMKEKEIGFFPLKSSEHFFKKLPEKVLHWHGEEIKDLPDDAITLASTELCSNQAFIFKNSMGIQFHPEFISDEIEFWTLGHLEEITNSKIDIKNLRKEAKNYRKYNEKVYAFWRSLIQVFGLFSENDEDFIRIQKAISDNLSLKNADYSFDGRDFSAPPIIYSHKVFLGGEFQHDFPFPSTSFLEIGTGSGAYAITAALKGAKTVATDICSVSLKTARKNASNLGATVDFREGDMFEPIDDEKFEALFFNIPLSHTNEKKLSAFEKAVFDPQKRLLNEYLSKGGDYLTKNGKLYITYSRDIDDIDYFTFLAEKYGWKVNKVLEKRPEGLPNIELYELTK